MNASATLSFQISVEDVNSFLSAFEDIHECPAGIIEQFGIDAAIILANLVGQIKEEKSQATSSDFQQRRCIEQAFEDKAKELDEARLDGLTDDTPYRVFHTLLERAHSSTSFSISNNPGDSVGSLVNGILRLIEDEGPLLLVSPEVKLNLFLLSLSNDEYEALCFEEIAEMLVDNFFA